MDWPHIALLHLLPTAFMTGVIWMCQVAHYPLLARVGKQALPAYQAANTRLTTWVVLPPMVVELVFAIWLVWDAPPAQQSLAWTGALLLFACWGSTFSLQVPLHHRLNKRFDEAAWRSLVRTNWIRTFAWTGRSVTACCMLW
jgi:uncharacterized membrane protein